MRLLCLAPGGVCQAADITAGAGGLLHHRFTLAALVAIPFSVALSVGSPRLAVSQHRTLWRADFPQPGKCRTAITRSAWTPYYYTGHNAALVGSNVGRTWVVSVRDGDYNEILPVVQ